MEEPEEPTEKEEEQQFVEMIEGWTPLIVGILAQEDVRFMMKNLMTEAMQPPSEEEIRKMAKKQGHSDEEIDQAITQMQQGGGGMGGLGFDWEDFAKGYNEMGAMSLIKLPFVQNWLNNIGKPKGSSVGQQVSTSGKRAL